MALAEYLCVEYLYFHAVARTPGKDPKAGTTFVAAASALLDEGQPIELAWPYNLVSIDPWLPPAISLPMHKVTLQPSTLDFDAVRAELDQMRPIVLGLVVTDAFFRPDTHGVVSYTMPDTERGGHAVLAVGYGATNTGEEFLLVRNSWGSAWGLGGYGWLPRNYVDRQLHQTGLIK